MHQEQIQPDFSYILNQDVPEQPKKRSFKLQIIAGLALVTILVVAAIVAILQDSSPQSLARAPISQQEAIQTNMSYFGYIVDGQTEKAYASFAESTKTDLDKTTYQRNVVERLSQVVNFSACTFDSYSTAPNGEALYKYRCPTKNNEFVMIFNMALARHTNGEVRITQSLIDVQEKKS